MKTFAIVCILGALALFGSAFFGVYTAPGLENLPTVESLGKKRSEKQRTEAKGGSEKPRATGIIPVNSNGAASRRRNQLNSSNPGVAPGR